MRTAGVDLSAAKERTAATAIEWGKRRAKVGEPMLDLDDEQLLGCLGRVAPDREGGLSLSAHRLLRP